MAGTAYHMEALRKSRVIEKKQEAMKKMKDSYGQAFPTVEAGSSKEALVFSEPGHYVQNSKLTPFPVIPKDDVVFEEVVHDPNFKYRILKESGNAYLHVDPIYKILYPGGLSTKIKLEKFRVNSAGFNNRYGQRDKLFPHCDLAYAVVYPGKDNTDYIIDDNKNNQRLNKYVDKYEMAGKVNGNCYANV